jgi:hypothetical protein
MPTPKTSPLTPKYGWDSETGRYRNLATGRWVPDKTIKNAVERQVQKARQNMTSLSEQLRNGEVTLQEWRTGMLKEIKTAHIASSVAAKGGWAQMQPSDWGRAGQRVRGQYDYLNKFASEIQYGKQPLDGRFLQRADMYGSAARTTLEATRRADREENGMTEERNVLHPAEHCDGCLEETDKGWVPIGTLTPIGERECTVNDHCTLAYR